MDKFLELFHSKLYDKEMLLKWELPEKVQERLGIDKYEFFFLTTAKEDSHEGHKHVHLSIFPTNYEIINLLEVETPIMSPKILQKILKSVSKHKFEILTTTGTSKEKNKYSFGIFFSKPPNTTTDDLITDLKKIKDVREVKIFNYTCEGCYEA